MPVLEEKRVSLPTGSLDIRVRRADWPLDSLCGFASRHNKARGYLFVSKVLGKHFPVRPSVMARVHEQLAAKILALDLAGPTVFIAMAETAVGLGHGVFEACLAADPRPDWLFLCTTRYALNHPVAFSLTEEHCHAREHLVYEPRSEEGRRIVRSVRNIVLIDDEMSTGRTMRNLADAFLRKAPGAERLVLASIKCWVDSPDRLFADLPLPVHMVSLLEGAFSFTPARPGSQERPVFKSEGDWQGKDHILRGNFGRLGLVSPDCLPGSPGRKRSEAHVRALRGALRLRHDQPVLVLGTGEFTHYPYRLAALLEEEGFAVHFQSTTRTPAALGHDIASALHFVDNYHEGIDNFLYNAPPDRNRQTVICYETHPLPHGHDLPDILGAQTVFFGGRE